MLYFQCKILLKLALFVVQHPLTIDTLTSSETDTLLNSVIMYVRNTNTWILRQRLQHYKKKIWHRKKELEIFYLNKIKFDLKQTKINCWMGTLEIELFATDSLKNQNSKAACFLSDLREQINNCSQNIYMLSVAQFKSEAVSISIQISFKLYVTEYISWQWQTVKPSID